jgi:hypothetical protein
VARPGTGRLISMSRLSRSLRPAGRWVAQGRCQSRRPQCEPTATAAPHRSDMYTCPSQPHTPRFRHEAPDNGPSRHGVTVAPLEQEA